MTVSSDEASISSHCGGGDGSEGAVPHCCGHEDCLSRSGVSGSQYSPDFGKCLFNDLRLRQECRPEINPVLLPSEP